MTMTRRHFEFMAQWLKDERHKPDRLHWRKLVEDVASMCEASNPNFNRARFLKACGVEE